MKNPYSFNENYINQLHTDIIGLGERSNRDGSSREGISVVLLTVISESLLRMERLMYESSEKNTNYLKDISDNLGDIKKELEDIKLNLPNVTQLEDYLYKIKNKIIQDSTDGYNQ